MFLFEEKYNVPFSRYLDFCVFGESKNFKISNIIIVITVN